MNLNQGKLVDGLVEDLLNTIHEYDDSLYVATVIGCLEFVKGEKHMSKEEALKLVKLLSAIESWAFSQTNRIPDYLIEDVGTAMKILEQIILKENK